MRMGGGKAAQNKVAIAAGLIKLFLKYNLKHMTYRFDCAVVSKLTHCGFHFTLVSPPKY